MFATFKPRGHFFVFTESTEKINSKVEGGQNHAQLQQFHSAAAVRLTGMGGVGAVLMKIETETNFMRCGMISSGHGNSVRYFGT